MFKLAEREDADTLSAIKANPPQPVKRQVARVTNEQRLILTNAEQVLTEFCLDFQVHTGTCTCCPLYLCAQDRCIMGIVSDAKRMIIRPQSTTKGGAEPCRS